MCVRNYEFDVQNVHNIRYFDIRIGNGNSAVLETCVNAINVNILFVTSGVSRNIYHRDDTN